MVLAPKFKVALLLATAAAAANQSPAPRSGEAALELVPADALAAVTADFSVVPGQVPPLQTAAFAKFLTWVQLAATDAIVPPDLAKPLDGHWSTGGAAALLPDSPQPDPLYLIAIDDPKTVSAILAERFPASQLGYLTYYKDPAQNLRLAVIGGYLGIAQSPWPLYRALAVQKKFISALADARDFQLDRQPVNPNSNLLVVLSRSFVTNSKAAPPSNRPGVHTSFDVPNWYVAGLTLYSDGVEITSDNPVRQPDYLSGNFLNAMPQGAAAVLAINDPARYLNSIRQWFNPGLQTRDPSDGFPLYPLQDLLAGDVAVGVYPAKPATPSKRFDLLFFANPPFHLGGNWRPSILKGLDVQASEQNCFAATSPALLKIAVRTSQTHEDTLHRDRAFDFQQFFYQDTPGSGLGNVTFNAHGPGILFAISPERIAGEKIPP